MAYHQKKPRLAIVSLTSCEGCQFVLLDQGRKFFDFLGRVEIDEFRLLEEKKNPSDDHYDICLVEGNPVTADNIKLLKALRRKSTLLIVLGNCAALGGVWELKNYQDKKKTIRHVYKHQLKVANPDIREVDNFVKVDFTIPGCPITGPETLDFLEQILLGKIPHIPQNPVCHECQNNGYECQLQKGKICLGPITLGGCNAICLKSKQPCWGCRGKVEGAAVANLVRQLGKKFTQQQINRVLEVFGLRDRVFAPDAAAGTRPAPSKNAKKQYGK